MAQLPLVIKGEIRDKFDLADSEVQIVLSALKAKLCLPVRVDVLWSLMWTEFGQYFVVKANFVQYICQYLTTLLRALHDKLDEDYSPWTEAFLDAVVQRQELRVELQTHQQNATSVRWFDGNGLTLYVPKIPASAPKPDRQSMLEHLEGLFAEPPVYQESGPSKSPSLDNIESSISSLTFSSNIPLPPSKPMAAAEATPLPQLDTLPRPEQLFSQSKLHIIHLRMERDRQHPTPTPAKSTLPYLPDRVIIQCTHYPSLKLIHEYFAKWTRTDKQTREKLPSFRYTLLFSTIGSIFCDTLVVEPISETSVRGGNMLNPALDQCFIEEVLGYEIVHRYTSEGHRNAWWEFRRSSPFA